MRKGNVSQEKGKGIVTQLLFTNKKIYIPKELWQAPFSVR
jgi:hypothetical protein